MNNVYIKKYVIPNIPYVFLALLFTKLGQAYRLTPGITFSDKALRIMEGFSAAFESFSPSFYAFDLIIGFSCALAIRLAVYVKSKNAKKFRKNEEYGSARWGTQEDIRPFVDPVFQENIILTQTERLMMSNRPKDPKNARNKNVLIVGGSGSGKTRFWIKPNLMQLHSSYVLTDPNRYTERGQKKPAIFYEEKCARKSTQSLTYQGFLTHNKTRRINKCKKIKSA